MVIALRHTQPRGSLPICGQAQSRDDAGCLGGRSPQPPSDRPQPFWPSSQAWPQRWRNHSHRHQRSG
ncbi:UNVERIFIED_CONTAM: hypothetical protein GTU68_059400 [Idotea baltica]|nr:hypothetical protein [Idotea baltica]